jgi:hypothetical protein
MKKTAVEWLYEQILLTPLDIRSINKCLEQAKEIEKIQNKYFHDVGFYTGRCTDNDKNGSFEYWINNYKNE